jgi:hypothetical protein
MALPWLNAIKGKAHIRLLDPVEGPREPEETLHLAPAERTGALAFNRDGFARRIGELPRSGVVGSLSIAVCGAGVQPEAPDRTLWPWSSGSQMCEASRMNKVLLHLSETRRRAVEPDDIFWVEAVGHDTLVRLRGSAIRASWASSSACWSPMASCACTTTTV